MSKIEKSFRKFRTVGYVLFLASVFFLILSSILAGNLARYGSLVPGALINTFIILTGFGITLISIYHSSGEWYSVFHRFENLGIKNAEPNRRGRDSELTAKWLRQIKKANNEIVICGVTVSGWFMAHWDDLSVILPEVLEHINKLEIFIIDPSNESLAVRDRDEKMGGESKDFASNRMAGVLQNLRQSMKSDQLKHYWEKKKILLYLYQGTPMSVLRIDQKIYSVTYLPGLPDRECPQLELSIGGSYSIQINNAISKIRDDKSTIRLGTPEEIDRVVEVIRSSPRADYGDGIVISEHFVENCDFCNEFFGFDNRFSKLYKGILENRLILKTSDFAILPTIGQITEGHVLIVPFDHCTSIGSLPKDQLSELTALLSLTRQAISSAYGMKTVFFEHGTVCQSKSSGGCGIYHMHVHAVPMPDNIDLLKLINFNMQKIESLQELSGIVAKGKSYLMYIDQFNNKYVAESENLTSQFMRIKVAEALGVKNWDWRQCQKEDCLIATYQKLSNEMTHG